MSACTLFFWFCFLYFACFPVFSIMSENLPNQVRKAIGAIEACQMDDLLYPERSIDHLDFWPMKDIFCINSTACTSLYVYIFL